MLNINLGALFYLRYPPPPVSKNHLAQEPTPGSAVKFSHHFFYQGSGFFMFLVDVSYHMEAHYSPVS